MNILAFDTSTEVMSIGVARTLHGQTHTWLHTGLGAAQASVGLIAGVLDLMAQAELRLDALDAICFGSGPGSFTGLRTACSVAQGLALGAGVPVLPIESLLAVAEDARGQALAGQPSATVMALLDARMDEVYTARYAYAGGHWSSATAVQVCRPESLAPDDTVQALAGNVFALYGTRLDGRAAALQRIPAMPTASALLRLAQGHLAQGQAVAPEHALPLYIRDKVAKTTLEREHDKRTLQAATQAANAAQ